MLENEDILKNDIEIQEKVENKKVESKSVSNTKRTKKSTIPKVNTKECDVLVYNASKKYIIISFDGNGYKIGNISENPGKKATVEYTGTFATSDFKMELKG